METHLFDELLEKVRPLITRQNTNMRESIPAHDKLCATLRFLASGASYKDLMYSFRIASSTISKFVPKVCNAIYRVLEEEYLKTPKSKVEWIRMAEDFEEKWQFPHAVGAVDGKHIIICAPPNTGSEYFNYKRQFSIVLLAVADANAKFIAFDLGTAGSQSDGGIFKHGSLGKICKLESFPEKCKIGQRVSAIPYFLLGDEAFALDDNLMKPYSYRSANGDEKVFNYRLSRARRIVENAFGILSSRFRILLRTLELDVENAMEVVRACLALHNYLITKKDKAYVTSGFMDSENSNGNVVPGLWWAIINDQEICTLRSNHRERPSSLNAREIRDTIMEYFYDEGAIAFQWQMTS